jgi:hypothetical protein
MRTKPITFPCKLEPTFADMGFEAKKLIHLNPRVGKDKATLTVSIGLRTAR